MTKKQAAYIGKIKSLNLNLKTGKSGKPICKECGKEADAILYDPKAKKVVKYFHKARRGQENEEAFAV